MPDQQVDPVKPKGFDFAKIPMGMVAFPLELLRKAQEASVTAQAAHQAGETGQRVVVVESKDWASPFGGYKTEILEGEATEEELKVLKQKAKETGIDLAIDVGIIIGPHYAHKLLGPVLHKIRSALFSRKVSGKDLWKIMVKAQRGGRAGKVFNVEDLTQFEREVWLTADEVAKNSGLRGISQLYGLMKKTGAKLKWIPKGKIGEGYWTIAGYDAPKPVSPTWVGAKPSKPGEIPGKRLSIADGLKAEAKQTINKGIIPTGPKEGGLAVAFEKEIIPQVVGEKDIALFLKYLGGKDGYLRELIVAGGKVSDIVKKLKDVFSKEHGKPIELPGKVLKAIQEKVPEATKEVLILETPEAPKVPRTVSTEKAKSETFQEYAADVLSEENPLYSVVTEKGTIKLPAKLTEEFFPLKKAGLLTNRTTASALDEVAMDHGFEDGNDLLAKITDLYYDYTQRGAMEIVRGIYKFTPEENAILSNYTEAILKLGRKKGMDKVEYLKEFDKIYEKAKPLVDKYPEALEKMGLTKDNVIALQDRKLMVDDATGLLKKDIFNEMLPVAVEQGKTLAMFDIKGVAKTNNKHGHIVGNILFKKFGDLWNDYAAENPGTQIARWTEGDEFMGIMNAPMSETELEYLNGKLIEAIKKASPELAKETGYELGMRMQQSTANPREEIADVMKRIDITKTKMTGDLETVETPEVEVEEPFGPARQLYPEIEKAKVPDGGDVSMPKQTFAEGDYETFETSVGRIYIPKNELTGKPMEDLEKIFDAGNDFGTITADLNKSLSVGDEIMYKGETYEVAGSGFKKKELVEKEPKPVTKGKRKQGMIPGTEKIEFPKEAIKPETPEQIAKAKAAAGKPMPLFEAAGEKGAEQLRLGSQKPPSTTADIGGYTVSPSGKLALPEIVEYASGIMGGKYPQVVKSLRAGGGMALGSFSSKPGTGIGKIKLRADIFATLEEAEKVLAHEIGHAGDWLPDKTLKRGNVLGRIASLTKYLKTMIDEAPTDPSQVLTSKERTKIRSDAAKDAISKTKDKKEISDLTKKYYVEMLKEEATKRGLITREEVMEELKTLSQKWKPFDENDSEFAKYRFSPKELYADAISVLLNDPKLLQEVAPVFYKAYFNYLDRKPQVKSVYNGILELIENEETLLAHRQARIRAMYGKGEEVFALKRAERKKENIIEVLRYWFYDRNIAATEIVEKAMKQGIEIKPEDNPVYWIEEMVYSTAEGESYMQNVDKVHQTLKKNGLTWEDLGDILFHERIIAQRAEMANPLGFTPETSTRQLSYMRDKVGEEKWKEVLGAVEDFREIRKFIIGRMEESHFVGPDLLKSMRENPEYAHFLVLDHYEKKFGVDLSGHIMPQVGALGEVANPATATIMKDMAILKDINRAQAAHKLIQLIDRVAPEEITAPDRKFNGKFLAPIKSKDPNWRLLVYPYDGHLKAYYVRPRIAEIFNQNPGTLEQVGKVLSIGNKFWKEVYVGVNYGFMLFNLCRDFVRMMKTTPGNPFKLVYEYVKAIPPAIRRGWGMDDATIHEMLKKKELITFGGRYTVTSAEDKQIEALMRKYEIQGYEHFNKKILWPFIKLFNGLHNLGQTIEMVPKVAVHRHLTKLGFNEKEIGHRVRTMAGSPDFLRKGRLAGIYNNIALFSNPMMQGWAGDIESYREGKVGYATKTVAANVVPKLLMYLGSIGALGLGIKKIYDRATEYDKANYTIVPLGMTENGKAVYLRVPQDEVGRFLGGVLWKAMTTRKAKDIVQLTDYTAGQVPSLAPVISMATDMAQYYTGRNPYDAFRGRYVLDQTVFEAGGWRSQKEFLKYMAKQGGVNLVYKFKSDRDVEVKSELEKVLAYPILSNILGRFVKVTDYGVREQVNEALEPVRQKRAEDIVLSRDAIVKIAKGEKPSKTELIALSKHPNIEERNLEILLTKRFGSVYIDMLMQAKNDEEKMVVWQKIMELEPADKSGVLQTAPEEIWDAK